MAWFDYLQGIGNAAAQGVQQFEGMQQQKRALERQRQLDLLALRDKQREQLKEQLQLISPEEELTQEAAKPYLDAFGAGAFTKGTAPGTLRRKLTPEQEATYAALDENRATRAAKKTLQQAINDGSINTWSDTKLSQVTRQAGVDPLMTPGLLTPKRALQFAQSVPKLALEYDTKMQQLAQQLAIQTARAENALASAETRAKAADRAADIRVKIAELQAEQRTKAELDKSAERRANTVLEVLFAGLKDNPSMIPKDPQKLQEMINTAMTMAESAAKSSSRVPAPAVGVRRLGKYAYEQ